MSEAIWVSDAMTDPRIEFPITNDVVSKNIDEAIEASRILKSGGVVADELCPKRLWFKPDRNERKIPDLFYAGTHHIVSARAADVLRQFDLGKGALYPVREGVFRKDNKTRIEGEYFTWIFGNVKTGFLEQYSPLAEAAGGSPKRDWCTMPSIMKDDAIAISREAQAGPDIWLDRALFKSIFFNGRLADALIAAGLKKAFRLYRCRVI
jgi:hypothetical protein